jgi:mono/diheme cytochrome c family protein
MPPHLNVPPAAAPRAVIAVVAFLAGVGALLAGSLAPALRAQETADLGSGRTLFNTYCASCHGTSGTGTGPLAPAMRSQPPDITGMALANGGVFPAERMRRIIDGRDVEAHGNREMPVWGDAFKSIPGGHSEEAVRARLQAILEYLESIQRRQA